MPIRVEIATKLNHKQIIRYVINGLAATIVHFAALTFQLRFLEMHSAGIANMLAAIVGITFSFLGNRYYVFQSCDEHIFKQAPKYFLLYSLIAGLHGIILYLWSDVWGNDYRTGFLFAVLLQVVLSYLGNKYLIFKT